MMPDSCEHLHVKQISVSGRKYAASGFYVEVTEQCLDCGETITRQRWS